MSERKPKLEGRTADSRWDEGRIKEARAYNKMVYKDTFDLPKHRMNPDMHYTWVRINYRKDGSDPDEGRINEAYLEGYDFARLEEFPEFARSTSGIDASKSDARVLHKGHVLMLMPRFLWEEKMSVLAKEQLLNEAAVPNAESLRTAKGGEMLKTQWSTKRSSEWDDD